MTLIPLTWSFSISTKTIRAKLPLGSVLAFAGRANVILAFITIFGVNLTKLDSQRKYAEAIPDVLVLISWHMLSTASFLPGALLLEILTYSILGYRLSQQQLGWEWPTTGVASSADYNIACFAAYMRWLMVITFLSLRLLSVGFALYDAREITRESLPSAPLSSSTNLHPFLKTTLETMILPRYDWWSLKPLPTEFLEQPWYQKLFRPFFHSAVSVLHQEESHEVTTTLEVLFGDHMFRVRRGDTKWFTIARGLIALALISVVACYGVSVVIISPQQEGWESPVQIQRMQNVPTADYGHMDTPAWGVILGINPTYLSSSETFAQAVSVFTFPERADVNLERTSCVMEEVTLQGSNTERWGNLHLLAFECASNLEEKVPGSAAHIVITVDYSVLGSSRSNFSPEGSVKVWPRVTKGIPQVLRTTQPTSLIMGMRTMASVYQSLRSTFAAETAALFGFDTKQYIHHVGHLAILGSDPISTWSTPSSGPRTSIRLVKGYQSMEWEMKTDVRYRSILDGMSALGGFAVFANKIFLILCGGSLMTILFNTKPLGVFGLAHSLIGRQLSERYAEGFPNLATEGGSPGSPEAGVVAFMREYMLDFGPLDTKSTQVAAASL